MKITLDEKTQVRLLCLAIEDYDLPTIRQMLDSGCPVSHPDVSKKPLAMALEVGREEVRVAIVDALVDAGACLASDPSEDYSAMRVAMRDGNLRIFKQAIALGRIKPDQLDDMLLDAVGAHQEPLALQLLELGASPMAINKFTLGRPSTALEYAAVKSSRELVLTMLGRMSRAEKDALLCAVVQEGKNASAVRFLLEDGANAHQQVGGRSLLQLAPRKAEEIKCLLRSLKTAASIEAAMPDSTNGADARSSGKPDLGLGTMLWMAAA